MHRHVHQTFSLKDLFFEYHLHTNNAFIGHSAVLCQQLGVSLDETVSERDLDDLLWVFGCESSAVRLLLLIFRTLSLSASLSVSPAVVLWTALLSGADRRADGGTAQGDHGKSFEEDEQIPHTPNLQQVWLDQLLTFIT